MDRVQEITLQYAEDRKQFGKSLSQFQVIQSYLAELAGEVSAGSAMLQTLLNAASRNGEGLACAALELAATKTRIGQAVRVINRLSHQIHGAMGLTQEYPLHLWTRRLWAWREDYGNETEWSRELGAELISLGPSAYWERITK